MNNLIYTARFIVETATPLAVGSGEKGQTVDRLIIRDVNGLPYIHGTSLAGVIRHELDDSKTHSEEEINQLFGFEDKDNGQGSRIALSAAYLVADDGKTVLEGIQDINFEEGYYSFFKRLPERDHVKITDKGVAKDKGKFDEQLVHKGTRFAFEIELIGTKEDKAIWEYVLQTVNTPFFRIGAGTRKGFGQLEVKNCWHITFDLSTKDGLFSYLNKPSSLNSDYSDWEDFEFQAIENNKWKHIKIELQPENFFLFGAGFGDEDVDMKPKTERYFDWSSGTPKLEETQEHFLIPATSVKGAISHRVAYHHNILQNSYRSKLENTSNLIVDFNPQKAVDNFYSDIDIKRIDWDSKSSDWKTLRAKIEGISINDFFSKSHHWNNYINDSEVKKNSDENTEPTQENNEAVKTLFGYAKTEKSGARGKVIFSDVYLPRNTNKEKVFSHVAIDRFTSGGIDGALYQEKAVTADAFELDIYVETDAFEDKNIEQAFINTLDDLMTGKLQLGGNTTKGHGAFIGTLKSNN